MQKILKEHFCEKSRHKKIRKATAPRFAQQQAVPTKQ